MVLATPYWRLVDHLAQKRVDIDSDALKIALVTSTYVPDLDAHGFFNQITNEASGTGYTAGGITLSSVTWTYNSTTDTWTLDAADVAWTTSTITARYAVIYDSTPGTAATNPLLVLIDFEGNLSSTAGTFSITFNASGILTIGKP